MSFVKKEQLKVNPDKYWKCSIYQGFRIGIVIRLSEKDDNKMTISEFVVCRIGSIVVHFFS